MDCFASLAKTVGVLAKTVGVLAKTVSGFG